MMMPLLRLVLRLLALQMVIGLCGVWIATAVGTTLTPDIITYTDETTRFRYDIFVLDVHRGITYNLTHSQSSDRYPAWSPDGSQLAFTSTREELSSGREALYIMDASGRNLRRVSGLDYSALVPAWSPDGRYLAYIVHVLRVNNLRVLDLYTGTVHIITSMDTEEFSPIWSPDGTMLAFEGQQLNEGSPRPLAIYVLDIAHIDNPTAGIRQVAQFSRSFLDMAWSPNSRHIAFTHLTEPVEQSNWDIAVVDVVTGEITVLTHHPAFDVQPAWSPDGTTIAFTSHRDGDSSIYLLDLPTGTVRPLTGQPANDTYAAWSPDGRQIVYTSWRGTDGIYLINSDGSGVPRLLVPVTAFLASDPAWRPQPRPDESASP